MVTLENLENQFEILDYMGDVFFKICAYWIIPILKQF